MAKGHDVLLALEARRPKTTRWAVRVTYSNGDEAYLRHGASVGEGPVVRFGSKRLAEIQAYFLRRGVAKGATVAVVRRHG